MTTWCIANLKEDSRGDPCKYLGTFQCGGCNYCQFMLNDKKIRLPNGFFFFKHKHHTNCKTMGVVYLLTCDCGCFYVGKTMQEIWKRAYRHVLSMKMCNPDLPLGRHVTAVHGGRFPNIKFITGSIPPIGVETGTRNSYNVNFAGYLI